jgi:hypothetical protein
MDENLAGRRRVLMGLLALLTGCGGKPKEAPFRQRGGAWHYHDTPITQADPATFQVLDAQHAKDRARVYFGETYRVSQDYFSTRRSRVRELAADAASFRLLTGGYARDARSMFHEGTPFPVRDLESFQVLDYGFARDRVIGYYHQRPVDGSDGSTFAAISTHYARDARRVYYCDLVPAPGEPRRVSMVIAGADPATFESTPGELGDGPDARDRAHRYRSGQRYTPP